MKITLGRYLNGNTIIHKLDARIKLFAAIAFVVLFFLANTFLIQFIMLVPLIIAFIITTKRPLKLFSMMKMPLWIGIFLFILNCFLTTPGQPGDIIWWQLGDTVVVSLYVVLKTANITLRIFSIILTITILTLSTTPVLLTKALEFYFYPLKLIKLPVNIFITIITIALRFIPTILDEANRILKAQASRGVDFKNGSIRSKVKSTTVLIIPLFVSAFTKADDLSNAMETRGYDPYRKVISYRKWKSRWYDWFVLFFMIALIVVVSLIYSNIIVSPYWFVSIIPPWNVI
ncbi:MAG: energy-coupling factor transporter transmembrane component T family protein [Metamycoplasmataceae bacterium]